MRVAFVETLEKQASKNKDIILISGDLGFSVLDNYISKFPRQYLNAGVSEQNMTGVAAGMAMEGKIPIIYSIVPFATMRNFEQIKNDICYQNLNVKIIGIGSGFSYGPYGHTHYSLEDVGILRTIPGITIFSPGDPIETELVTREALKIKGPVYIRLGKADGAVHDKKFALKTGQGIVVRGGKDIVIFATGIMLFRAIEVSRILEKNYSVLIVSMPWIKPLDKKIVLENVKNKKYVFSLEEHFVTGGLGSVIAEILSESKVSLVFKRIGVPDVFSKTTGDQEYMRKINGLSLDQIVSTIKKTIRNNKA